MCSALKKPHHSSTAGKARQVALLVETAIVSGREILKGIGRFLREGHPWSVVHEPRNLHDAAPDWIRPWKGSGIIARVSSPEMATTLQRTGLPVVDVLGLVKDTPFPLVHVDNAALARLAVEHLSSQRPASLAHILAFLECGGSGCEGGTVISRHGGRVENGAAVIGFQAEQGSVSRLRREWMFAGVSYAEEREQAEQQKCAAPAIESAHHSHNIEDIHTRYGAEWMPQRDCWMLKVEGR